MADDNKTEKATPQRRKKAREQGQVARSKELSGVFALFGVAGVLMLMTRSMGERWTALYTEVLNVSATESLDSSGPVLFWSSIEVLRWIVPILGVAALLSLFAGVIQGGISIAPEALSLKFDRLNPASRLGQIFSSTSLNNLLKSLIPFGAILWFGVSAFEKSWGQMIEASDLGVREIAALIGGVAMGVAWKAGAVLLLWSGVDYLLTWQKLESDLRMSREEVKREYKDSDGNPAVKGKIRQLQRAMRRAQTLKAAETATLVITNPTHYAVALRYEPTMAAPEVVAKGRDLVAAKIKEIARQNGVMVMENKPLAQALYKSAEVGDAIPAQLYQAVAEILVMVFRAQADVRAQEAQRRSKNAAGEVIRT